ncbi:MAG: T9SS type A sorting domain-containing protein [Flavobacteriales bacterium]|nr:T9SS type A sorting domain-containing protein [Flavobacteriales bacterium]
MKKITLLVVLGLFNFMVNAQTYQWAKRISGSSTLVPSFNINVTEMIASGNGDIYISGSFTGTVDFDTSNGVNNKTSISQDGFIAGYTSNGVLNWVYTTNASGDEEIAAISFYNTVAYSLSSVVKIGTNSMRIDRVNRANGNVLASSPVYSSTGTINIKEMNSQGIIVGGYTGVFTLDTIVLTSAGLSDGFSIRATSTSTGYIIGNALSYGGTGEDIVNCIYDDYMGGSFSDTANFGTFTRVSSGGKDGFFFRYNASTLVPISGNFTKIVGGTGDDEILTIVDFSGVNYHNVIIGGYFNGTANFNVSGATTNITSNGGKDGFIAAYNYVNSNSNFSTTGNNKFGSTFDDEVTDLSINDLDGLIYFCGKYGNTSGGSEGFVGSRNRQNNTITSYSGNYTPSVATGTVNPVSVQFLGSNVYYAGEFSGTTDFNIDPAVTNNLVYNTGGTNSFLQRSSFCVNSAATATIAGPTSICAGNEATLTLAGAINSNEQWNWYSDSCNGTYLGSGGSLIVSPNATTNYYVIGQGGCVADGTCSLVKTITVNSSPLDTTTLSNSTLTATQTGATYQWIDCGNGNANIAGATSQSFTPIISGNYAVKITLSGCEVTSACTQVNVLATDEFSKLGLTLFPNPAQDYFVIEGENQIEKIDIYNLLGQKVKSFTQPSTQYTIDELSSGTYIIEATTENGVAKTKLVIE